MTHREIFSWKFPFYQGFLPALRRLGPARADAALTALARADAARPARHRLLARALARADAPASLAPDLAAGILRSLARDYLLDTPDDAQALAHFDVHGEPALADALAQGRGVILVGSHYGAHISAFHYLYRRAIPLRLMVQRPKHVSPSLNRFFDRPGPLPQSDFFLRRSLDPAACVARVLRCRDALKSGHAVYFPGDVPWSSPNTRPGHLLGQPHRLLTVWADLAALTGSPVFHLTCTHLPLGRFSLTFSPDGPIPPGHEDLAVTRYLTRLDAQIHHHPPDAVAHLLWPCYGFPLASSTPSLTRPSRHTPALSHFS